MSFKKAGFEPGPILSDQDIPKRLLSSRAFLRFSWCDKDKITFRISTKKVTFVVRTMGSTKDSREWLTENQLNGILSEVQNIAGKSLFEANKEIHRMLLKGTTVNKNELTGEQNPTVRLVDFRNWDRNTFTAINQFRINTPGSTKTMIIPDIVLFLNGMPVVVVEAKDDDENAQPLSEAYTNKQIRKY